tara:strand:- start:10341 stop:11393 length:1053 start_codon:yes stop_codon:yes gene_type:complete
MVDKPFPSMDDYDTIILIDGGYFVFRMTKHWSKKGRMFKANQRFKRKQINYFQRQHHFKKAIEADISYIGFRLGELKKNPKYESSCMAIVCYDGIKGRQRRGQLHPLYKGNRYGAEEDYNAAGHEGVDIREKLSKMGLEPNNLEKRWFSFYDEWSEGDDLLAELTQQCIEKDKEVIVMSSDSDMIQLLRWDNVKLHNFTSLISIDDIERDYGFEPKLYADWKALCGDSADNISGVPYIGKTKAKKLILQYGAIEEIPTELLLLYTHDEELKNEFVKYRELNELCIEKCKKRFGTFWERIEAGEIMTLSPAHHKKLAAIDLSKNLIPIDYKNKALLWKRLVKIPFKYQKGE